MIVEEVVVVIVASFTGNNRGVADSVWPSGDHSIKVDGRCAKLEAISTRSKPLQNGKPLIPY